MNLHTPIQEAGRVYKMYGNRLEKLGITTIEDFLFHIPFRYEDFSLRSKIGMVQPGEKITIVGQVMEIKNVFTKSYKKLQRAVIADETGEIEAVWFNQPFLTQYIQVNDTIALSGRVETFGKKTVMQSPEYEMLTADPENTLHTGRLVPVYPETKGVSSKWLRRQIHTFLHKFLSEMTEYLPEPVIKEHHFLSLAEAVQKIHFPGSIEEATHAKARLAFDELFLLQLAAIKRRREWEKDLKGHPFEISNFDDAINTLKRALPFTLTSSQDDAISAIYDDLKKAKPMNRLLQGDVGSGKTVVSAFAIYSAYLNGYQSVLMAPTEILAEQHFKTLDVLLRPLGLKVSLITGSKKLKKDESFDVLVGTHAVLVDRVAFEKLGLVVIDEQQRFGVEQRSIIRNKGNNPHFLTMTATPIPRTVALTLYGDLDLSYLSDMPKGRKLIRTWLVPREKRDGAYGWIRKQIKETSSQVFIICPFIEESESMQTVKAATVEYEHLRTEIYPDLRLGILHGKMKAKEKNEILEQFRAKAFDILVATPVVEVGIDIPNATVIMIEAAERFGLAQLHQLRGRVGRGEKQSYCLLFTENTSANTVSRLQAMETSQNGAELAETDLKLRGPGELYGTLQSGVRDLKIASFHDLQLIQQARNAAERIFPELAKYPELEKKVAEITIKKVSPD